MELTANKLSANVAKLVSYPLSYDSAPVPAEAALDKRVKTTERVAFAGIGSFVWSILVGVFQLVGLYIHTLNNSYRLDPPMYEPLFGWVQTLVIGLIGLTAWAIAQGRNNTATDLREKLYYTVLQGRVVGMDHRGYGSRPHIQIEGHNARNQIRTQWRQITDGEWENWVKKFMTEDVYVDYRPQGDAGE